MKFTLSWLKDHLETQADLDAILATLTRIGLEVEGIDDPAERFAGFRIARVLAAERHPQADKLQVLSVDTGDGAALQVVCGAPNARAGLVGVLGTPGAIVPANGMQLRVSAIRGVESNGMMCSSRELELGDDHDGIIELPGDAPVGTPFADFAGLGDPVIEVSVTPNRQDCMGVRGIARDLAAAGLGSLKPLAVDPIADEGAGPDVRTDDPAGCPAFLARTVTGVTNGAAPDWMQRRLKAIGQKPISALVDITNYVMFDLGRPLHVYDRAHLTGGLIARAAAPGEQVLALNGKTYTLARGMTVIADAVKVHDIGGIMGGEESGVTDTTTDVLIECAYFTPEAIARTGQALNLSSDARARFERGVDPALLEDGLAIATRLVLDLCGGRASEVTRAGQPPVEMASFAYDPALAASLGGLDVPVQRQRTILASLGFDVTDDWRITPPTWRRDVDGPADIVEEVIRIEGLDNVPSTPLPRAEGVARPTATAEQRVERRVRRAAAARGLNEAVTWSFLPQQQADAFGGGARTLANPISEDMKVMRPSLLPGLLAAAQRNLSRGATSVRLFESGRRYLADAERPTLAVVLAGERAPRGWQPGKAQPFDAYDAKAEALALLEAAGAPVANLQVMGPESDRAGEAWHPGQSGTLRLGPKTVLAAFGIVHPSVTKAFDLAGSVAAVELYPDAIPAKRASGFMRGADKATIIEARLFDVFEGAGVGEGMKSLAIEVVLQPGEKSFTDADLKAIADRVVAAAAKLGATLRG